MTVLPVNNASKDTEIQILIHLYNIMPGKMDRKYKKIEEALSTDVVLEALRTHF